MRISVVIATRDRPGLLRRALDSVLAQHAAEFEVIVVDDGSAPESAAAYGALADRLGTRGRFHRLPAVAGGHGPGFARNQGVAQSGGDLIAFLDDDDEWIDPDYLARTARNFAATPEAMLHYANQEAMRADGSRVSDAIWIETLAPLLRRHGPPRADGVFLASPAQVLECGGFCHLNATVIRRTFFDELGGFDASLRYEEDRDLHLRAIDRAGAVMHDPRTVARHHIPERGTASTRLTPDQRTLDQLRLLDKAILRGTRPEVRAYARRFKAYTLKSLAQRRAAAGDLETASFYAGEVLGIGTNPKWAAYTAWLGLKRRLNRATRPSA